MPLKAYLEHIFQHLEHKFQPLLAYLPMFVLYKIVRQMKRHQ